MRVLQGSPSRCTQLKEGGRQGALGGARGEQEGAVGGEGEGGEAGAAAAVARRAPVARQAPARMSRRPSIVPCPSDTREHADLYFQSDISAELPA